MIAKLRAEAKNKVNIACNNLLAMYSVVSLSSKLDNRVTGESKLTEELLPEVIGEIRNLVESII